MNDQKHTQEPEPLYSCCNDGCRENISYPSDMLAVGPNGPVCESCWDENDRFDHTDEEGESKDWHDLPVFNPRMEICAKALEGIDDPAAFMRDVRGFFEMTSFQGDEGMLTIHSSLLQHLKGSKQ